MRSDIMNNSKDKVTNNSKQYSILIIGNGTTRSICLNEYGKNVITFGRSEDNDIVLSSPIISSKHGTFIIENDELKIKDNRSKNGIFLNGTLANGTITLKDGDFIKIDNPVTPLQQGVIMLITVGKGTSSWLEYDMIGKNSVTIGRSKECDIVLERISVPLKHAKIERTSNGYEISYFDNKSGIIVNNRTFTGKMALTEKDVILIDDIKIILSDDKLIYQKCEFGVRLDAIDIVKTVRLKFKKRDISQHVNFSAAPGEFIAFVGGSGAGKSTFIKCISGVNKPTSGQVLINGSDLYANYDTLKKLIGYVPQENIIFDDLTLKDVLKYAANLRMPDDTSKKEKLEQIDKVLEIVEMLDKKDVMIRNLSGGQQKRACIAVELLSDPKLFFLDEPTSGLDPGTERSLMKTLRKMANSGKTIILVTHNTLNLHLCDKVVFFGYGGKLCFDGKPKDALSFFGVDDFVDIYNLLNNDCDKWEQKFKKIQNKTYEKIKPKEITQNSKTTKSKSFIKQFLTLTKRKLKTLFNNKTQMLLIFGQAPLIAFLLSFVVTKNMFYSYEETKSVLFTLATASIWIGLLNSIQEVCKEKVILFKEYMSDLRVSAYLLSKVTYFIILSLIQSVLFIGAFSLAVDVPAMGVEFSWFIENTFTVFLTILSASSMGLFVSCIAKDTSVALTLPALLLIPQMLFSGILFPLEGIVNKLSSFILCRWTVEALGTTNDLNSLVSSIQEIIPGFVRDAESYFTFTTAHLSFDLAVIALMTVILIFASYLVLKKILESGN